ncbi:hypothetical protein EVAR_4555_1 [Eumeta japonica]|uniref:Uncharacterized protein n=1 Tax=Eumeta variegata TaxID=151549 RepID=A0A4C1SYR5_EUMVA|nr:hypothetical protein EVAR_4555_1 [Eumeta japonica]
MVQTRNESTCSMVQSRSPIDFYFRSSVVFVCKRRPRPGARYLRAAAGSDRASLCDTCFIIHDYVLDNLELVIVRSVDQGFRECGCVWCFIAVLVVTKGWVGAHLNQRHAKHSPCGPAPIKAPKSHHCRSKLHSVFVLVLQWNRNNSNLVKSKSSGPKLHVPEGQSSVSKGLDSCASEGSASEFPRAYA